MTHSTPGSIPEPKYSLWQQITLDGVKLCCTSVSWSNAIWDYAYSFCAVDLMDARFPGDSPFQSRYTLEQFAVEDFQNAGYYGDYTAEDLRASIYWEYLLTPSETPSEAIAA